MATFKLDIKKEFGKLHHRVYPSTGDVPEFGGATDGVKDLLAALPKTLEEAGVTKADTVIFRQVGYDDNGDLREAVRTATY